MCWTRTSTVLTRETCLTFQATWGSTLNFAISPTKCLTVGLNTWAATATGKGSGGKQNNSLWRPISGNILIYNVHMNEKINRFKDTYFHFLIFMVTLLWLWYFVTVFFSIPDYIVPSPYQVWLVFKESHSLLLMHSLVTLREIMAGFIAGASAGFVLAIAVFSFKFAQDILSFYRAVREYSQTCPCAPLRNMVRVWYVA